MSLSLSLFLKAVVRDGVGWSEGLPLRPLGRAVPGPPEQGAPEAQEDAEAEAEARPRGG